MAEGEIYRRIAELLKKTGIRRLMQEERMKCGRAQSGKNSHYEDARCAAQCLQHEDDRYNERTKPEQFLPAPLLPARPVGDSGAGGRNAAPGE